MIDEKLLIREALEARKNSYAPYSHYHVGAALLTESGKIYRGCNVENAAFSPGICAERNAVSTAAAEGERSFRAIAIVGGYDDSDTGYAYPCGVCRQVLMEFAQPESFQIIVGSGEEDYSVHTLKELLPFGFGPSNLS